ncbi:MAG: TIGR03905 family TSCPD domain-containing protein [Clostridiales Family XIII bacterium]|jgi:uncharacterized protein (TIGR03905 family)|nr:TIGR03905 family TSCPD domain-containing protein [Clostridiales Family XIII bacterium]
MKKAYRYTPSGVCSSMIEFRLDGGKVSDVRFTRGCNGNAKGIASLVEGMPASEVIEKLSGTTCGGKPSSCPDQLATALRLALEKYGE